MGSTALPCSESGRFELPGHDYFAYGLGIRSLVALPELLPARVRPDVRIRLGRLAPPRDGEGGGAAYRARAADGLVELRYEGVGRFLIREGREIRVDAEAGVAEGTLRVYLLGAALGVLLRQRGWLVLHASAVAIGDAAVAFAGGTGWGKSTTAAALYRRGHRVVADDLVVVRPTTDGAVTWPGFPRLRITAGIWRELAGRAPADASDASADGKFSRPAGEGFHVGPMPLRRIYVLETGHEESIEALGQREALAELVRHSYGIRLLGRLDAPGHFLQCAEAARKVGVRRLRARREAGELDRLAEMVEEDAVGRDR